MANGPEHERRWDLSAPRRPGIRENLERRHLVKEACRSFLGEASFLEVDTPILAPDVPEYAGGLFQVAGGGLSFSLPQSPQFFKQAIIAAGIERYFQFAHCFRLDMPDPERRDLAMEFMQLDLELAATSSAEIRMLAEGLVSRAFAALGVPCEPPFPVIDAVECLERYGTDKPDLREDVSDMAFLWVVDFPLVEGTEDGVPRPTHHPVAMPHDDIRGITPDQLDHVRTHTFDLVLNGVEIGGGDLRIHDLTLQEAVLETFGLDRGPFEPLLDVLAYGVVPHGGMGIGLDRLLMAGLGLDDVSDVIAFPIPVVLKHLAPSPKQI